MASPNFYRVRTLVIPVSGTTTGLFTLDSSPFLGIRIPTLDSCTLTIQGLVRPQPNEVVYTDTTSGTTLPILNNANVQVLKYTGTTGGFVIADTDLHTLRGLTHIEIVCSAGQNTATAPGRLIYLLQRTSL